MTRRAIARTLCAVLAATGCAGDTGTITITLVTAPGSDILDGLALARLTLSDPPSVAVSLPQRDGRISLDLDVEATGRTGTVTFEGLDSSGESLLAYGVSAPLPITSVTAEVAIYVAEPLSLASAPVELLPARSEMAGAELSFGVLVAGGRLTGQGGPVADVAVYSAYRHDFQPALPLGTEIDQSAPRAQATAVAGAIGDVYLFGGRDQNDQLSPDAWRLVTSIPPRGVYLPLGSNDGFARAGASAAPVGAERFVVTGSPPLYIDGLAGEVTVAGYLAGQPDAAIAGTATSAVIDGRFVTLFIGQGSGEAGAVVLDDGEFAELSPGPDVAAALLRTGHATVRLPDDSMLTVGGAAGGVGQDSAVLFRPAEREFELLDGFLTTPRQAAQVAATRDYLVVAGGVGAGGDIVPDAEVFFLGSGRPEFVASIPMVVPRQRGNAAAMVNGQIFIAGGIDASGDPIATVELFTPRP